MSHQPKNKGVGPVDQHVPSNARPQQRIEDVMTPFKVDKSNPKQQELAKLMGWGRLKEIEEEEKQAFDEAKDL